MVQAYTEDSEWRNRDEFFKGREEIVAFLKREWERELDYRLMQELWCYQGNRISVRFEYEARDGNGQWWRSHLPPVCNALPRRSHAGSGAEPGEILRLLASF